MRLAQRYEDPKTIPAKPRWLHLFRAAFGVLGRIDPTRTATALTGLIATAVLVFQFMEQMDRRIDLVPWCAERSGETYFHIDDNSDKRPRNCRIRITPQILDASRKPIPTPSTEALRIITLEFLPKPRLLGPYLTTFHRDIAGILTGSDVIVPYLWVDIDCTEFLYRYQNHGRVECKTGGG